MSSETNGTRSLREMELEVEAEGGGQKPEDGGRREKPKAEG
jgi:hypothetical protein